jgi:PEP-CTERM motif
MPVDCFTVMRLIARPAHRHIGQVVRRASGHVPHLARRVLHGSLQQRPATVAAKVCIASGLAGLGAAGIVAAGLAFAPASAGAPQTPAEPAKIFGSNLAGGSPDPAFALDPASTAAADPPISFDPGDPGSSGDPGTVLDRDDPGSGELLGPGETDDPADPRDPTDPREPPAPVPEPSSAAILAMALAGAALWRSRLSRSMARDETAGRRRAGGGR